MSEVEHDAVEPDPAAQPARHGHGPLRRLLRVTGVIFQPQELAGGGHLPDTAGNQDAAAALFVQEMSGCALSWQASRTSAAPGQIQQVEGRQGSRFRSLSRLSEDTEFLES